MRKKDSVIIEEGRTSMLRLRGPNGNMDIVGLYWATGQGYRAMRKESMTRLAMRLQPAERVLTVIAGDFNCVNGKTDRICGSSGYLLGTRTNLTKIAFRSCWRFPFSSQNGLKSTLRIAIPWQGHGKIASIAINMSTHSLIATTAARRLASIYNFHAPPHLIQEVKSRPRGA